MTELTELEEQVAEIIYDGILAQFSPQTQMWFAMQQLEPRDIARQIVAHVKAELS